ncbi:uncharacterized protein LOC102943455 isoform X5 [Chelonia mydas]|uniref:uncharacterized protein LOC102943455 isoform X5 n=1 Tax=Chelonia mydas TaxID=8469 RepID=UPI001CA9D9AD|nr:uncharacterized protein LOC102943455 isoform X5 [Chelonia mydas]
MEEAFFQLYQEFTHLQDLCAKQAELLQKLTVKKEPMTVPTWPNAAVLRDQPQDADTVSHFAIKYPLSAANNGLSSGAKGKADFAIALSSQNHHKPHVGKKAACDTLLKNYTKFPALKADKEKSTAPPIPPELATLNPEDVGSFPSFLDLYEAPQDLQMESTSLPAAEIKVPIEIRGPTQPRPKDFIQSLLKNR